MGKGRVGGPHFLRRGGHFELQIHDVGVGLQLIKKTMRYVSIVIKPTRRCSWGRNPAANFATVVGLPTPVGPTSRTTHRSPAGSCN